MKAGLIALVAVAFLALGVPFIVSSCQYESDTDAERFSELFATVGASGEEARIVFEDETTLAVRVMATPDGEDVPCFVLVDQAELSRNGSDALLDVSGSLYCPDR